MRALRLHLNILKSIVQTRPSTAKLKDTDPMDRILPLRCVSWRRLWMTIALGAVLLCWPAVSRATDPVARLKEALKLDPSAAELARKQLEDRRQLIEKTILPELKTIAQLRRAYFLKEWGIAQDEPEKIDPKLDVRPLRTDIEKMLTAAVRKAAQEPNVDHQIDVAIMIAELAESEQPMKRSATGKFASVFSDVLVGGKSGKGLVNHENLLVRQSALNALGKITPKPADAKPAMRAALQSAELGPRRLAAYALTDLVKNAHYLEPKDEMETLAEAVSAAVLGLRDPHEDESIRGYCLQTVHAAAKMFTDYPWSLETAVRLELEGGNMVLDPSVRKILQAFQDSNPRLASGLQVDLSVNIRLASLDALNQIVRARIKIMEKLSTAQEKLAAEKRDRRGDLFKAFQAPDPIGRLLEGDWEAVSDLLKKEEDVRLRRGAIAILEMVVEDVELAITTKKMAQNQDLQKRRRLVQGILPALYDKDLVVRWSAARSARSISRELITEEIIVGLGHMLIDPIGRDPDLSAVAVASLEVLADSPHAPKAVRFLKSAITDLEKDVDVREGAMRTLVQIGGPTANSAFPEVIAVLTDSDVRMRRMATETLGVLGQPATRQIAEDAIAALKIALRDDDAQVRHNASEAILSIRVP